MALISVIMIFLAFSPSSHAEDQPSRPVATFRVDSMMRATCLARSAEANAISQRYDVRWVRWFSNGEAPQIVAGLISEAERLSGHVFAPFTGIAVDVDSGFRILGLQSFDEQLQRQKVTVSENANVALLAHEMGHLIGNAVRRGEETWYKSYFEAVPTPCHYTDYSEAGFEDGRRNEEFAEVYAGYMTAPDTLKARCSKAHEFMRKTLFPKGRPQCAN